MVGVEWTKIKTKNKTKNPEISKIPPSSSLNFQPKTFGPQHSNFLHLATLTALTLTTHSVFVWQHIVPHYNISKSRCKIVKAPNSHSYRESIDLVQRKKNGNKVNIKIMMLSSAVNSLFFSKKFHRKIRLHVRLEHRLASDASSHSVRDQRHFRCQFIGVL